MALLPLDKAQNLYTASQTQALDQAAIAAGTPGFDLMMRAGRAAFRALRRRWPEARSLSVLCGHGNKGGDALVVAGLAVQAGFQVELLVAGGEEFSQRLQGEALQAYQWVSRHSLPLQPVARATQLRGEVVVDGLLGTGLRGEVRGAALEAIALINGGAAPVLALDIPSGLCADTGRVLGQAVRADMTISFVGLKRGLLTGEAVDYCGELLCDDLDIEPQLRQAVSSRIALLGDDQVLHALPHRARSDHKGLFGHLLVVGGDYGMAGAVLMAAQTALRCGAGLVSVATRPEHVPALVARCPELMVHGVRSGQELESLLERATQVLIGPGLGQSAWSSQLWNRVQGLAMPTVVDADALNLIAQGAFFEQNHGPWVLTPHPGEAARLLGVTTKEVQADRFAAAERLQQRYKGVIVLKGAGTLVEDGRAAWLCRRGNPGMASGGMGDTLAGGIAALLAQGLAPVEAACAGVQAHAWAADREAAEYGERGMLASDLVARMRTLLNGRIC